jgi:erythronate-4-phosphate dehydrogenase
MRIIADDKIPFLKGIFEPYCEIVYVPGQLIDHATVKNADALIVRTRTVCNEKLLKGTNVKFIATATIGYDHIDTLWCEANGVLWTNAPGCNSGSVMQYIASTIVYLSKKHGFNFEDKTLGVVGVGNVGWKIVKLGEALGLRIIMNDPPVVRTRGICGYVSLEGLLREADIITAHVPLNLEGNDKTYHLFDHNILRKTLPGTILINSSRGEVVDPNALHTFIDNKHLRGAVLDVWENEPNIDISLLSKLDIATPHIAGYSADGKANGTLMSVKACNNFFRLGIDKLPEINIPVHNNMCIEIDCKAKTSQEVLCEAIEFTYTVASDDNKLRDSIGTFEKQRGDYPLRREFQAYTVKLQNSNKDIVSRIKMLGFTTEQI